MSDKRLSANKFNQDLKRIHNWAFQWKMSFKLDPSKQAQEVILSRKLERSQGNSISNPEAFSDVAGY